MILSFNHRFVPKIMDGTKIHSIRNDKYNRWYEGYLIHMATGTRTSQYNCFNETKCTGTQSLLLDCFHESIGILEDGVVDHWLTKETIDQLSVNDGFDRTEDFWEWFRRKPPVEPVKLIHWTDLRY